MLPQLLPKSLEKREKIRYIKIGEEQVFSCIKRNNVKNRIKEIFYDIYKIYKFEALQAGSHWFKSSIAQRIALTNRHYPPILKGPFGDRGN